MVNVNRPVSPQPPSEPRPGQNTPTAATVRPTGSLPAGAQQDTAATESPGFFSQIGSFFQKAAETLGAVFDPIDSQVSNKFAANSASRTSTAAAPAANGDLPATSANYSDLSKYVQANPNLGYFELERGNVNQKLSQYLTQFKDQIEANPELRQQLAQTPLGQELLESLDRVSQGKIGTDDVLALQKFAVASGINIGHSGSATGIDGQFGPKTLEGVQKAFEKMMADPTASMQAVTAGAELANQGVEALRQAQDGVIDRYQPGASEALPDSDPNQPLPTATDFGNSLVSSAQNVDITMNNSGKCLKGVRLSLEGVGIQLRDPRTGSNLNSAYMAADVLANQHSDRFTETSVSRADLRNLPPGSVVVWDRNPNPNLRAQNPSNGFSHGHIEVIGNNGQAYSDGRQSWGVTMNNNNRYGGFRVFVPNS